MGLEGTLFSGKSLGIGVRRPGFDFWFCHSWVLCSCTGHYVVPPLIVLLCKLGLCVVSKKCYNSISSPSSRTLSLPIRRQSLCPLRLNLGRSLWLPQQIKCVRSDIVWLPRLGHKRHTASTGCLSISLFLSLSPLPPPWILATVLWGSPGHMEGASLGSDWVSQPRSQKTVRISGDWEPSEDSDPRVFKLLQLVPNGAEKKGFLTKPSANCRFVSKIHAIKSLSFGVGCCTALGVCNRIVVVIFGLQKLWGLNQEILRQSLMESHVNITHCHHHCCQSTSVCLYKTSMCVSIMWPGLG